MVRRLLIVVAALAVAAVGHAQEAPEAGWPGGRGFEVGETVPDIPLFDMDGNEVRFSRFLGKQYVLYCWASW